LISIERANGYFLAKQGAEQMGDKEAAGGDARMR
jgi:hypothetical protein